MTRKSRSPIAVPRIYLLLGERRADGARTLYWRKTGTRAAQAIGRVWATDAALEALTEALECYNDQRTP